MTVTLRKVVDADLPIFFDHQLDRLAVEMAAFPSRSEQAFMAHWARILADPTVIARTVLADEEVVGNVVSWVQDGCREIGYWLGRAHWGRGVATAAVAAFLPLIVERPLCAHVVAHNTASRRVLEKCGFTAVETGGEETVLVLEKGA